MSLFQSSYIISFPFQGRRPDKSGLAPGYYIFAPLALENQTVQQPRLVALPLSSLIATKPQTTDPTFERK